MQISYYQGLSNLLLFPIWVDISPEKLDPSSDSFIAVKE